MNLKSEQVVTMVEGWKARINNVRGVYIISIPLNVLYHGYGSTKRGGPHSKLRHAPGSYGSIGTYNPETRRINVWSSVGTRGKGYAKWAIIEAVLQRAGIANPTEIVGGPPASFDPPRPHRARKSHTNLRPALRKKLSQKIRLLRHEGYRAKQAAAIAYRTLASKRRRDPGKSYERRIEGFLCRFTYHSKTRKWSGVLVGKKGHTLPLSLAKSSTSQAAEESARTFLKKLRPANDPSRSSSRRTSRDPDVTKTMLRGIEDGLWLMACADMLENAGEKVPRDIRRDNMPEAPREVHEAAVHFARALATLNKTTLPKIVAEASRADGRSADPEELGFYLAMQAQGHGVSWFDSHAHFSIKLPHVEAYANQEGRRLFFSYEISTRLAREAR